MEVVKIGHSRPEAPGFCVSLPQGVKEYYILHFWQSFEITLNGQSQKTDPHAVIIFDSNAPQYYRCNEKSVHDWFTVSGNMGEQMKKYGLEFNTVYQPENYNFISSVIRKIESETYAPQKHHKDICNAYLQEFFVLLSREISSAKQRPEVNPATKEQLKRLRRQLQLEYNRKWEIADMANFINLSESYLYSAYKKFYGISPKKDLIGIRMQRAKYLLESTKQPVGEIAVQLGYTNSSHFIRQFTSSEGISPFKYRQRNRNYRL